MTDRSVHHRAPLPKDLSDESDADVPVFKLVDFLAMLAILATAMLIGHLD